MRRAWGASAPSGREARAAVGAVSPSLAVGAAIAVALIGLVSLAQSAGIAVQSCVPLPGGAGWLGAHLALVRDASHCAEGTYALGGSPDQVLVVIATCAIPLLLLHSASAATSGLLALALRRLGAVAVRALRRLGLRLPLVPPTYVAPGRQAPAVGRLPQLSASPSRTAWAIRGPPPATA